MTEHVKAARLGKVSPTRPGPLRRLGGEAKSPFNVHGHRHACLFRALSETLNSFNVLNICKEQRLRRAEALAYLGNIETGVGT